MYVKSYKSNISDMLSATDSGYKSLTKSVQGSFCNKPSTAAEMSSAVSASKIPTTAAYGGHPYVACHGVSSKNTSREQSSVLIQAVTGRAAGVSWERSK